MRYSSLAFDLDGTLFDNENEIWNCYLEAGVDPPNNFWGLTAREWLTDEDVHRRKNDIYIKRIPHLRPTPMLGLFYRHGGMILTGASWRATTEICRVWLLRPSTLYCGVSVEEKIEILNDRHPPGVYLEDRPEIAKRVEEETRWKVLLRSSHRLRD